MSQDIHFFHGSALSRIIKERKCIIERLKNNQSSYLIDDRVCLYIKYSSKRTTPWRFSIHKSHIHEITLLAKQYSELYIVLVCYYDGIVCLTFNEFKEIIESNSDNHPKWVKAQRKIREKYCITGSDGKLKNKIADSNFPKKIFLI
jgi:hypothetical protein